MMESYDFNASPNRRPNDGAYRRVHPGGVTAAGQNANSPHTDSMLPEFEEFPIDFLDNLDGIKVLFVFEDLVPILRWFWGFGFELDARAEEEENVVSKRRVSRHFHDCSKGEGEASVLVPEMPHSRVLDDPDSLLCHCIVVGAISWRPDEIGL